TGAGDRLALYHRPGELLESLERLAFGPDQQTELGAGDLHLDCFVLVVGDEAGLGRRAEPLEQADDELLGDLALLGKREFLLHVWSFLRVGRCGGVTRWGRRGG